MTHLAALAPVNWIDGAWDQQSPCTTPFDSSSYYLTPLIFLWTPGDVSEGFSWLLLTPLSSFDQGSPDLIWPRCPHLTPLSSFNPTVTSFRGSNDLSQPLYPYLTYALIWPHGDSFLRFQRPQLTPVSSFETCVLMWPQLPPLEQLAPLLSSMVEYRRYLSMVRSSHQLLQ